MHPLREVTIGRVQQQVVVVVHEAEGMASPASLDRLALHQPQEQLPVSIGLKDVAAARATVCDVSDCAGGQHTGDSRHALNVTRTVLRLNPAPPGLHTPGADTSQTVVKTGHLYPVRGPGSHPDYAGRRLSMA